jgi:hypothetical protein
MTTNVGPQSKSGDRRLQRKRSTWRSWLVWISLTAVLLLVAILLGLVWNERRSATLLDQELQRITRSGQPIDSESMGRWFQDRTHTEGTQQWGEVFSVLSGSLDGYPEFESLPVQGRAELPERLVPGGPWPEEPIVADYLEYSRPLIDMIDQASEHPSPVWRPIEFQGIMTLLPELQSTRSISRLLMLEAEHALYHQDAPRALRAIRLLDSTADAFDWDFCMVAALVHVALRGIEWQAIQRSLYADLWNEQQLQKLAEQVGPPIDIASMYRDTLAGERAFCTNLSREDAKSFDPTFGEFALPLVQLPSTRLRLLEIWQELQDVADGDPRRLSQNAERVGQELNEEIRRNQFSPGNILAGLLIPATSAFTNALIRMEDNRRFTRTALAIKQYQLQLGQWPQQLSELQQVGLTSNDWSTQLSGPFGYELKDDAPLLWKWAEPTKPVAAPLPDDLSQTEILAVPIR